MCRVHCTRGSSVSSSEGTKRWRMRQTTAEGGINVYCCSAPSGGRGKAADTVASPIWLPSAWTDCGVTTFPYPALFLSFRSFPVSLLLSLLVRPSFCQFRAISFSLSLSLSVVSYIYFCPLLLLLSFCFIIHTLRSLQRFNEPSSDIRFSYICSSLFLLHDPPGCMEKKMKTLGC